jgi:hypothetical protein
MKYFRDLGEILAMHSRFLFQPNTTRAAEVRAFYLLYLCGLGLRRSKNQHGHELKCPRIKEVCGIIV